MNQLSKEKEIIAYGHRLRTLLNYHTRVLVRLWDVDAGSAGDDDNDSGGRVMIIMLTIVTYGKIYAYEALHYLS